MVEYLFPHCMVKVFQKEPMRRGAGKPHLCEFLYRIGGTQVWVCSRYPNGLTDAQYAELVTTNPDAAQWSWRRMARDP